MMTRGSALSRDVRISLLIFCLFLGLYLLFSGDHFTEHYYSTDEQIMFMTTRSIMERGSLVIPDVHGQTISKYGLIASLTAVPFYLLGRLAAGFFHPAQKEMILIIFMYMTNAFITAAAVAVFFLLARVLRYPLRVALHASLVLGAGTILFPYARFFFSESPAALFLLLSLLFMFRFAQSLRVIHIILSSLFYGLLLLTRFDNISLVPVFVFAILYIHRRREVSRPGALFRDAILFAVPLLSALAVHFLLNRLKYGSVFTGGYDQENAFTTPPGIGLFGLLLSPGRGIFFYSPPLVLALAGAARFGRKRTFAALVVLFIVLIKAYLFSRWYSWHGGLSWGGRFLLPLVPLMMLPFCDVLIGMKRRSAALGNIVVFIVSVGVAVQLLGILVKPSWYSDAAYGLSLSDINQSHFIPHISPWCIYPALLMAGRLDSFIPRFSLFFNPLFLIPALGAPLGLAAVSFSRLRSFLKPVGVFARSAMPVTARGRAALVIALVHVALFILGRAGLLSLSMNEMREIVYQDGRIERMERDSRLLLMDEMDEPPPPSVREIRIQWRGTADLPLTGEYGFHVKSRGKFLMMIGSQTVALNTDNENQITSHFTARLERGRYPFRVEYYPSEPHHRVFNLYATFPEAGVYKMPVTSRYFHQESPAGLVRVFVFLADHQILLLLLSLLILPFIRGESRDNKCRVSS